MLHTEAPDTQTVFFEGTPFGRTPPKAPLFFHTRVSDNLGFLRGINFLNNTVVLGAWEGNRRRLPRGKQNIYKALHEKKIDFVRDGDGHMKRVVWIRFRHLLWGSDRL